MSEEKRKPTPEEKAAAAAAAKAKAEEMKKLKEQGQGAAIESAPKQEAPKQEEQVVAADGNDADAKAKAAAAAKAKAAAAAAAKAKASAGGESAGADDDKAKAAAAAKAKAAAAAAAKAKAAGTDGDEEVAAPKAPSKNQPYLDKYVKVITSTFGDEVIESSYINELGKDVPTIIVKNERLHDVAKLLKEDSQLHFEYLSNLHGVDYENHMEVYYHLYSYKNRQSIAVKVKTNREKPSVASVMDIWAGANFNERETYDLLGINFPGHSDLRRIMLADDWIGHPLRKDYVQFDEGV